MPLVRDKRLFANDICPGPKAHDAVGIVKVVRGADDQVVYRVPEDVPLKPFRVPEVEA